MLTWTPGSAGWRRPQEVHVRSARSSPSTPERCIPVCVDGAPTCPHTGLGAEEALHTRSIARQARARWEGGPVTCGPLGMEGASPDDIQGLCEQVSGVRKAA